MILSSIFHFFFSIFFYPSFLVEYMGGTRLLNWHVSAANSRPDLSVDVSLLQSSISKPTVGDLNSANKAVRKLRANQRYKA